MADITTNIQLRNEPNKQPIYKFGSCSGVTTTEQVITKMTTPVKNHPQISVTTALSVRIKAGGNVNDTLAGSGAQKIHIYGFDANYKSIDEVIDTNGSSVSSATTKTFIRVFRAFVSQAGSGKTNTGDIIIELTDGTEMVYIESGLGQTQLMMYCTPADRVGIVYQFRCFIDSNQEVNINFYQHKGGIVRNIGRYLGQLRTFNADFSPMCLRIPEKTDIWLTAQSTSGTSNVSASGEMLEISA